MGNLIKEGNVSALGNMVMNAYSLLYDGNSNWYLRCVIWDCYLYIYSYGSSSLQPQGEGMLEQILGGHFKWKTRSRGCKLQFGKTRFILGGPNLTRPILTHVDTVTLF